MPNPQIRSGFERSLFYGTAGSTAGTRLENVIDLNHDIALDFGDTTTRGDSSSVPIGTQKPTKRTPKISWGMLHEPNDAELTLIRAAAKAGAGIALVIKEYDAASAETTIMDGDFNVTINEKGPLAGEGGFDFEATATRDYGRTPSF